MPYQPTFPSPYMIDVDINKSEKRDGDVQHTVWVASGAKTETRSYNFYNTISLKCLINPKDTIVAYSVTIKDLSKSSSVYTLYCSKEIKEAIRPNSEKPEIELSTTFPIIESFPVVGGRGDNSWLEIELPVKIPSSKNNNTVVFLENGKEYSWQVRLYDKNDNYTDSPPYYFRTRPEPIITFDIPEEINACSIESTAEYSQKYTDKYAVQHEISVAYHSFELYCNGDLIDSTGDIYSPRMDYVYNNLIDGNDYTLKLTITNDNGMEFIEERDFRVRYNLYETTANPIVSFDSDKNCVIVDYSDNIVIAGKSEKNNRFNLITYADKDNKVSDTTNALSLNKGQNIFWDEKGNGVPLNLTDTYQIIHWHGRPGTGQILEITDNENSSNNIKVWYSEGFFFYKIGLSPQKQISPGYNKIDGEIVIENPISQTTDVDENKLYMFYGGYEDVNISDSDYILSNDLLYKYWWYIVILPDEVRFIRGEEYKDKVVSEV